MPVHARIRACHVPKRGNNADEYEDAYWPRPGVRRRTILRAAVADGATETSFSARWAQLLTRAYCRGQMQNGTLPGTVARLQTIWSREVSTRPLPWYAAEKVRQGAFSSLLGITIGEDSWQALAIGDSCLFHVRHGTMRSAFPLDSSAQFGSTPHLLSSNGTSNAGIGEYLVRQRGTTERGDLFLLATDALASWFLASVERGERPWETVRDVRAGAGFARWVDRLRDERAIRNDDSTVMLIEIL